MLSALLLPYLHTSSTHAGTLACTRMEITTAGTARSTNPVANGAPYHTRPNVLKATTKAPTPPGS